MALQSHDSAGQSRTDDGADEDGVYHSERATRSEERSGLEVSVAELVGQVQREDVVQGEVPGGGGSRSVQWQPAATALRARWSMGTGLAFTAWFAASPDPEAR